MLLMRCGGICGCGDCVDLAGVLAVLLPLSVDFRPLGRQIYRHANEHALHPFPHVEDFMGLGRIPEHVLQRQEGPSTSRRRNQPQ